MTNIVDSGGLFDTGELKFSSSSCKGMENLRSRWMFSLRLSPAVGVRGLPLSETGILGDWPSGGVFTKETERRILVCNESVFHEISTKKEKSLGLYLALMKNGKTGKLETEKKYNNNHKKERKKESKKKSLKYFLNYSSMFQSNSLSLSIIVYFSMNLEKFQPFSFSNQSEASFNRKLAHPFLTLKPPW